MRRGNTGQPILGIRLHGGLGCEEAVRGVERSIGGLDDRRVVEFAGGRLAGDLGFEVAGPLPRPALVVGQRDGQPVPAAFGVVVDQGPPAVPQADDLGM